jgi:putative ATPase
MLDVEAGFTPAVPAHLRSSGLSGDGRDYEYPHDLEGSFSNQVYLPQEMGPKTYYNPKANGYEATLLDRLKRLMELRRKN